MATVPRPTPHQVSVLRSCVDSDARHFAELRRRTGLSAPTIASAIAGQGVHPALLEKLLQAAEDIRRGVTSESPTNSAAA